MKKKQMKELIRLAGDRIRFNCDMARYTTFKIGGKAEAIYEADNEEGLRNVIRFANRESVPYLPSGLGSNLLVRDGGLDGLVVLLRGALASVKLDKNNAPCVLAGGGFPISRLMNFCRESGLSGLEFLAGIPGTVGGAVVMNAGAFGKEIDAQILEIYLIGPSGRLTRKDRSELRFSYRALDLEKGSVVTRARLKVGQATKDSVSEKISAYLKKRKETQPLEYPSAGSIFKNPANDHAGRLIERAGLKGKTVGGAMISEKHANYIVNTGGATAKDVLELLRLTQEKVRETSGIMLEPEIKVVGR